MSFVGLLLTDKSGPILANVIRSSSETLQTLTFYGNQFSNKTIRLIASSLVFCNDLSVLAGFCPSIKTIDPEFALAIDRLPMILMAVV